MAISWPLRNFYVDPVNATRWPCTPHSTQFRENRPTVQCMYVARGGHFHWQLYHVRIKTKNKQKRGKGVCFSGVGAEREKGVSSV